MDVNRNLISAEFGGFSGLKVDTNRNFRLINFSESPRFQFRAGVIYYRASLYIIKGSK